MTDSLPIPAPHREGLVDVVVQVASPVHHIGESGTTPPAVGGAVTGPLCSRHLRSRLARSLLRDPYTAIVLRINTAKEMSLFIVCHASFPRIGPWCT